MKITPQAQPKINPYFILALGVIAVSFSAFLGRGTDAPPAIISFYRLFITCLLLTPLAIKERAGFRRLTPRDLCLCSLSGLFLSVHFVFWFASLRWTSVSSAALLVNIHPLVVVSASWLLFGEKVRPAALPWAGVALIGIVLMSWGDLRLGGTAFAGNLFAAGGGLMLAGYYLLGRQIRPRVNISIYSFLVYSASTILLLIYNVAAANPFVGYAAADWLIFSALAMVPTLLGHTLLNWALKYLPAGAISVSVLGEPVIATALAIPLFREVPGPLQLLGGLIVIGSIWRFLSP